MQPARHLPRTRPALARLSGVAIELWPALVLLAIYALNYVQFAAELVRFPFDLDQGEGYDAWSAWLLNLGQLPYTSNADFPYYSSNYPPLWSYLVSIPMAWLGPGLGPARVVSAIAALATAGVLGIAAQRMTGRALAGVLAAGFFLASPYVFHTTPLARVNSLALLCAVTGLTLLERPTRRTVILGSLALLAALYTKPTTIDATIAGVASVALRRPALGMLAAAFIGGLGIIGIAVLVVLTRGAFWLNVVVGNANPFELSQLVGYAGNFIVVHAVLVVLAAAELARLLSHRTWSPWAFYGLTASVAALGVGKWGAGESYFLGAIAAICVLSAVWIGRFLSSAPPLAARLALGLALFLQAGLLAHASVSAAIPWLPDRGPQSAFLGRAPTFEDQRAAEQLVSDIRRARGPVLSEDPSFGVVARGELIGNATQLRNLHVVGHWDAGPLVDDVRAHRYAMVILDAELYPEPVLQAIGESYFLDRAVRINGANYHVFLPGTQ